jgi:hypothetical protein
MSQPQHVVPFDYLPQMHKKNREIWQEEATFPSMSGFLPGVHE